MSMFTVNLPGVTSTSTTPSNGTAHAANLRRSIPRSKRKESKDWKLWSVDDVSLWLRQQLQWSDDIIARFRNDEIDGAVLPKLTHADALNDLALTEEQWREFAHHVALLTASTASTSVLSGGAAAARHQLPQHSASASAAPDDAVLLRTLQTMPRDCQQFVLEWLTFTSFSTITRVCRAWRQLFYDRCLWMALCSNSWHRMGIAQCGPWTFEQLVSLSAEATRAGGLPPPPPPPLPVYVVHGLTTLLFAVQHLTTQVKQLYSAIEQSLLAGRAHELDRHMRRWRTLNSFLELASKTCVCIKRQHIAIDAAQLDSICQALYGLHTRMALARWPQPTLAALLVTRQPFPFAVQLFAPVEPRGAAPLEVRLALSPFVTLLSEAHVVAHACVDSDGDASNADGVESAQSVLASVGRAAALTPDQTQARSYSARLGALSVVRPFCGAIELRSDIEVQQRFESCALTSDGGGDAARSATSSTGGSTALDRRKLSLSARTLPLATLDEQPGALGVALGALIRRAAFVHRTSSGDTCAKWSVLFHHVQAAFMRAVRAFGAAPRGLAKADCDYLHRRFCDERYLVTRAQFDQLWAWLAPVLLSLRFRRHYATLWTRGFIHGLIARHDADRRLQQSGLRVGTFLLRFSESLPGAVTISYVADASELESASDVSHTATGALPSIKHHLVRDDDLSLAHSLPELVLKRDSLLDILQEQLHTVDAPLSLSAPAPSQVDDEAADDRALQHRCACLFEPECNVKLALRRRSKKQVLRQFWAVDCVATVNGTPAGAPSGLSNELLSSSTEEASYAHMASLQDLVFI